MEGIAHAGSIVGRRPPPVAGAARRSRSDATVEEPSAPGVSSTSQSRTISVVASKPPIRGSHYGATTRAAVCLPRYAHYSIPPVKFARVQIIKILKRRRTLPLPLHFLLFSLVAPDVLLHVVACQWMKYYIWTVLKKCKDSALQSSESLSPE